METFWGVEKDVNTLCDSMCYIITDAANLLCLIKKIRLRNDTPGWFIKELQKMINRKQKLMRQI